PPPHDARHLPSFPTRRSSDLFGRTIGYAQLIEQVDIERVRQRGVECYGLPAGFQVCAQPMLHEVGESVAKPLSGRIIADVAGKQDRKSTRLNSSHVKSSYAVF